MEDLKKRIEHLIEMEHRSLSMDAIIPLYISRMLNAPLAEVEQAMQEIKSRPSQWSKSTVFWLKRWIFWEKLGMWRKKLVMCWWIGDFLTLSLFCTFSVNLPYRGL